MAVKKKITQTVRVSDQLMLELKVASQAENRSIPKQAEHWMQIGKMVEDNPDLTYEFIRQVLRAKAELDHGVKLPYVRISPQINDPDLSEKKS